MAKLLATNKSNTPELDPGVYPATVIAVEEAEGGDSKYDKGLPREVITYRLRDVLNDEGKPLTLKQWVTIYTDGARPKSAIYGVLSAILNGGQPFDEGADLDTDELVGKPCRVQWGKKEKGEGMGITAVYPPKAARSPAPARRTVTAEEIDEI